MGASSRTPSYFNVARSIFEHPLFAKHPEWMRPFLWLISDAAWKARGQRLSHGIVHVERGQFACTIRGLAAQWGWKRGNVEYFLRRLREEEMIETFSFPTKIQTKITTRNSYRATMITICNYDRFQTNGRLRQTVGEDVVGQNEGGNFRQDAPQLPGIINEIPALNNQATTESKNLRGRGEPGRPLRVGKNGDKSWFKDRIQKPKHGSISQDRVWQWFDYLTEEWQEAAKFDKEERSLVTFPRTYEDGGRGNWFKRRTHNEWHDWAKKRLTGTPSAPGRVRSAADRRRTGG